MNREQRRAQKKAQKGQGKQPEYKRMTKEQRIDALIKNGITVKDLENEYRRGYKDGFTTTVDPVVRTCYAAICLALRELHGFGAKRCKDVLNLVDQKMLYSLTSIEIVDEVWEEIGLKIDFTETLDERITEVE